ncbi:MAG: hypothetical protein EXS63_04755 [Candidatus Omnitrophica bacterium]|nr:hypothetical protein [Candidatus Omnitrophota bacterium]
MIFFLSLIQVILTGFAAHTLGKTLASRWIRFDHDCLSLGAYCALGLLIISYGIFGLVYTHHVSARVLFGVYAGIGVLALPSLKEGIQNLLSLRANIVSEAISKNRIAVSLLNAAGLAMTAISLYLFWIWLVAALPPTSVDEVIYHLAVPQAWLRHGGGVLFPNNIYAYFPQLGEMFFLLGLGTLGETAARLYHSLWGILLALSLYGFSRRYLSRAYSFLAVIFLMTIPSVMVIQSWAYVDLAYSLYAFLALVSILDHENKKGMIFAGIMAGGAFAAKYTGLQYLILLICLGLWMRLSRRDVIARSETTKQSQRWLRFARSEGIFIFSALLIGSPYLIRNWIETGWPLFPFQVLGFKLNAGMHWDPDRARLYHGWLSHFGAPLGHETIWHTLLAPVLVFVRGRFNEMEHYEGILGPLFLMTPLIGWMPGTRVVPGPRKVPGTDVRTLGIFSLIFLFYWAFTTKQIRFLLPVMPVISFLLAWGLSRVSRRSLTVLAGILMTFNLFVGVREVLKKNPWAYWSGRESREVYLTRQLDNYPFYQKVNRSLGPQDKVFLINMKNYGYFLDRDFDSDFIFERWRLDAFMNQQPSESQISNFFKNQGVNHLMMDEVYVSSPQWGFEPDKLARFKAFIQEQTRLVVRDGPYALYRLK